MKTIEELKAAVKEFLETDYIGSDYNSLPSKMFHSEYPEKYSKWNRGFENAVLAKAKEMNLQVDFVDNFGGEGEGDSYWSVYSFSDGDSIVYVKFNGWYASYNGAEYDEWFFVKPKEVMVTRFDVE